MKATSEKMKRARRLGLKVLVTGLGVVLFYVLLLTFPQPFFRSSVSAENLTLYSDEPFSADEGRKVLDLVRARLETSPLYIPGQRHSAFICNAGWRQRIFFNKNYGVGGINYYPVTANVFLRNALIDHDLLISPSGRPVGGDRTLDYFIAHEITHTLTVQAAGWLHYTQLPEWVREGYADYVAKGGSFNYEQARKAFLAGAPEMDRERSGLYLRYHLLVAHFLDKEHWTVQKLLANASPQERAEQAVREEQNDR